MRNGGVGGCRFTVVGLEDERCVTLGKVIGRLPMYHLAMCVCLSLSMCEHVRGPQSIGQERKGIWKSRFWAGCSNIQYVFAVSFPPVS
jgi:hypothetical protein